jgi:hypothetical protein
LTGFPPRKDTKGTKYGLFRAFRGFRGLAFSAPGEINENASRSEIMKE